MYRKKSDKKITKNEQELQIGRATNDIKRIQIIDQTTHPPRVKRYNPTSKSSTQNTTDPMIGIVVIEIYPKIEVITRIKAWPTSDARESSQ